MYFLSITPVWKKLQALFKLSDVHLYNYNQAVESGLKKLNHFKDWCYYKDMAYKFNWDLKATTILPRCIICLYAFFCTFCILAISSCFHLPLMFNVVTSWLTFTGESKDTKWKAATFYYQIYKFSCTLNNFFLFPSHYKEVGLNLYF